LSVIEARRAHAGKHRRIREKHQRGLLREREEEHELTQHYYLQTT